MAKPKSRRQADIHVFITDAEATAARDTPGLYKNHREFIITEFYKLGFVIEKFEELKFDLRSVDIHGRKTDGFLVSGIIGQSLSRK